MNKASPTPSRRVSVAHLALIVPWVALVVAAWSPLRDNSFLWHVRAGTLQLDGGRVLTADPFSFTMLGEQWLTQSWLAELLYAWSERVSGIGFVPPMLLLVSSITMVGIGLIGYRASQSVTASAIVLILSSILLISFLVPRPVIFSFALFVLVIIAWERPATRWALPFLIWLWASIHGSFAIGLAYVVLSLIVRREWRWLSVPAVGGVLSLATAHGLGVVAMLVAFGRARDTLSLLSEWRKPELWSAVFLPFAVGVVIIVLGAFRGRITPNHLWVLVPFLLLGLSATRALPPAWIGLIPLVGLALGEMSAGSGRRFSMGAAAVFVTTVLILPFLIRDDGSLDPNRFPLTAVGSLSDVNTFHDDVTGGYLIWVEGPERLVYLDDRAELYQGRIGDFVAVRDGDVDWEPVFAREGIEQALLKKGEYLAVELESAGWTRSYDDESFVILRP